MENVYVYKLTNHVTDLPTKLSIFPFLFWRDAVHAAEC